MCFLYDTFSKTLGFFSLSRVSSPLPLVFFFPSYTITKLSFFTQQVVFHVSSSENCFGTKGNNSDSKTLYDKAVLSGYTAQSKIL